MRFIFHIKTAWRLPLLLCIFLNLNSCSEKQVVLRSISVEEFSIFVEETGYQTDAEQYGWSIVQESILAYDVVDGANWKFPDGKKMAATKMPVTQVSYNDAMAFCNWANARLPSYQEYWKYAKSDHRDVVINSDHIYAIDSANVVGNTWDITTSKNAKEEIRLAGGSYLCNRFSCNGSSPDRKLFVSTDTGNSHISFSVIRKE